MSMEEHEIELRSGAIAHYVVDGPTDGPPVLLLHGGLAGSSGRAGFRYMIPALAQDGFRVYAPDRPGFGQADTRPEHWPRRGFLSWVEFTEMFVDALGIERLSIGGNSQGAQTAAYYAVRNPERVERMALVACGGFNPVLDIPVEERAAGMPIPTWDGTAESMRAQLEAIVYRTEAIDDALIEMRCAAAQAQRDPFAAAGAWNKRALEDPTYGQAHRLAGHLDRLGMPIIYLYGRDDVLGPVENGYAQEDRLPNVQFFYPAECGHQGQTDRPELFNAAFSQLFGTGAVSRATATAAGVSTRRPELPGIIDDQRDRSQA